MIVPAAKKRRIEVSKIPETNNDINIAGKKGMLWENYCD
jgi:hypothetical protein